MNRDMAWKQFVDTWLHIQVAKWYGTLGKIVGLWMGGFPKYWKMSGEKVPSQRMIERHCITDRGPLSVGKAGICFDCHVTLYVPHCGKTNNPPLRFRVIMFDPLRNSLIWWRSCPRYMTPSGIAQQRYSTSRPACRPTMTPNQTLFNQISASLRPFCSASYLYKCIKSPTSFLSFKPITKLCLSCCSRQLPSSYSGINYVSKISVTTELLSSCEGFSKQFLMEWI